MPKNLLLDNRNVFAKRTPSSVECQDDVDKGLAAALQALEVAAGYDTLRLKTYRDNEQLEPRIQIAAMGSATLLRFDDVGYFNRVYSPDQSISKQLSAIEDFYSKSSFGCELIGPPMGTKDNAESVFRRRGWTPGYRYAWLHGRTSHLSTTFDTCGYTVRQPRPEERLSFLLTYLGAFEAHPEKIDAAVRNMRHLFDCPALRFMMAFKNDEPAGIGMMFEADTAVMLCAGATLPAHRGQGCHTALLEARIRLAIECGWEELVSWADADGQSRTNMERAGLKTVGITQGWRYRANQTETEC
jgi:GNAT superfamily N-acetyltransferase